MSETLSIRLGKVEKRLMDAEISATRFLEIFQELIACLAIAQRQSADSSDPEHTKAELNLMFIYWHGGELFQAIKDTTEREAMLRACRAFTTDDVLEEMIGARPFEGTAAEILERAGFRQEGAMLFTKKQRERLEFECQEGSRSDIRGFIADLLFCDLFNYLSSSEAVAWYSVVQKLAANQRFLSWEVWLERFKVIAYILQVIPSEDTLRRYRRLCEREPKALWKALFHWVRACGFEQIDLDDDPLRDDTDC